jgi:hypothetical protein
MMMKLLEDKQSSSAWVEPEGIPFFQHNREEFLLNYTVNIPSSFLLTMPLDIWLQADTQHMHFTM